MNEKDHAQGPQQPEPDDSEPRDDQQPSQPLTPERALEVIQCGKIVTEHGMLRWSSNYTFLLSIEHEGMTVMVVYKPRKGERPLWDFPDGTLYLREVASFQVSQALGWQIVPPTVAREGAHGVGSMQFFIDHDPEYNYFAFDESLLPQLRRMAAFDAIVNNADRKGGHCLVDSQGHLWGIDQGLTFNTAHKLRTVIWDFAGQPIPDPLLQDLDKLCARVDNPTDEFRESLAGLLSEREIKSFQSRIRRLLKSGTYPQPGPGPNYPWPPV